jgi:ABC-type spermidine/putrescine transport system permease subunit I
VGFFNFVGLFLLTIALALVIVAPLRGKRWFTPMFVATLLAFTTVITTLPLSCTRAIDDAGASRCSSVLGITYVGEVGTRPLVISALGAVISGVIAFLVASYLQRKGGKHGGRLVG